jgi:glutamate-1-semialdehyde aminotransferase
MKGMKTDNMMSRISQILTDNGIPVNVAKINGHFEVTVTKAEKTVKVAPSLLDSSFVHLNSTPGY